MNLGLTPGVSEAWMHCSAREVSSMIAAPQQHRLGRLIATPEAMASIPRSALGMALRSHAHVQSRADADQAVETRHSSDGLLFRLHTDGDWKQTMIRLEHEV
jgi:hypothetical protein